MKKVFITGVSSGFGKQALHLILERGHKVIAGVRGGKDRILALANANPEDKRLKSYLEEGKLHVIDLHVHDLTTFAPLSETIEREFSGQLDVIINNAGFGLIAPFEALEEKDIEYQMDVNFNGPACLIKRCLPFLRKKGGKIINVSSIMGVVTLPFYSAYCASKYALEGFSEALHYELRPFGIQVCLIEPGGFKTNFVETANKQASKAKGHPSYDHRFGQLQSFVNNQSDKLGDPFIVAQCLANYVDAEKIPLRRPIGQDGVAMAIINRLLPKWLYVLIIDFFFRLVVFRGPRR